MIRITITIEGDAPETSVDVWVVKPKQNEVNKLKEILVKTGLPVKYEVGKGLLDN